MAYTLEDVADPPEAKKYTLDDVAEQPEAAAKPPASWSDVPRNALEDVKGLASGVVTATRLAFPGAPPPSDEEKQAMLTGLKEMPGNIANEVLHPIESFKKHPVNVALDAASVVDPALRLGRAAFNEALPLAERAGVKAVSASLGPKTSAIEARMEAPGFVKNAIPSQALAEKLSDSLLNLQKQVSELDGEAWKTLSKSANPADGAIPKEDILGMLGNIRKRLEVEGGGLVGRAAEQADATLSRLEGNIKALGGPSTPEIRDRFSGTVVSYGKTSPTHIPESSVKQIIQDIDKNTDWNAPGAEELNNSLESFRTELDQRLKGQNTEYAAKMLPVAERVELLQDIPTKFNMQKQVGGRFVPGNKTATNLETALKEKSLASHTILQKLKQFTGDDFLQDIQNAEHAKEFKGGVTQGSRRTTPLTGIGAGVGGTLAGPVGATAGGVAGFLTGLVLDVNGRKIAGDLIDYYVQHRPKALGPYAPILSDAIRGGAQAFAIVHNILSKDDPNYRKTLAGLKKAGEDALPEGVFRLPKGNLKAEEIPASLVQPSMPALTPDVLIYEQGIENLINGDVPTAKKLLNQALKLNPDLLEAQRALDRIKMRQNRGNSR